MRGLLVSITSQIGTVLSRRQPEAELARARRVLAAVVDSLSEGIVVQSADGRYRSFDRATRAVYASFAERRAVRA